MKILITLVITLLLISCDSESILPEVAPTATPFATFTLLPTVTPGVSKTPTAVATDVPTLTKTQIPDKIDVCPRDCK